IKQLQNMPTKFMPGLDRLCTKYPAGSSFCYTPHVIVSLLLLGLLILALLMLGLIVVLVRVYCQRKSAKMDDTETGDRLAEKVKLTSNSDVATREENNNSSTYEIDSEKGTKRHE